ncbi:MAG: hypothetical protein IT510_03260 [Sulfuritalea sp.]|jgi:hypothetical protein|nr:hypothetical protein [Sulfuritalea sp.]
MKSIRNLVVAGLALLALPVLAADFDGSKPLLCATQSALDCARGDDCATGLPEEIGAPTFMRIDLAKKSVIGPQTTTEILLQDKSGKQLLLQGRESGFGWTIVIDQPSGELTVTLTNRNGAYVLYGACTAI